MFKMILNKVITSGKQNTPYGVDFIDESSIVIIQVEIWMDWLKQNKVTWVLNHL